MRLLVIDPDRHLCDIVSSVMSGEGHDVMTAESGDQALRMFREAPADLVLGLMELDGSDGLVVLRQIRALRSGERAEVILMSAARRRYDRLVQDAMVELSARDFLHHPYSVLDLVDMLRRIKPQENPSRESSPPQHAEERALQSVPRGRYSNRNLNALTRLWSSSASGILHVDNAPCATRGRTSGWVTLQNGGPAHSNDWGLIRALLQGGEVRFERASIEVNGDRNGLGRFLYFAVFDEAKTDFVERHRFDSVLCTEPLGTIASLPISDAVLALLRSADGARSLGILLAEGSVEPGTASTELYALRQLQMVVFQTPRVQSSGFGSSGSPAPGSRRSESKTPPRRAARASTEDADEPVMPSWMSDESTIDDSFVANQEGRADAGVPSAPAWLSNEDVSSISSQQVTWLGEDSEWSKANWTKDASAASSAWAELSDTLISDDVSSVPELPEWMRDAELTGPPDTDASALTRDTALRADLTGEGSQLDGTRSRRTPRSRMTEQLRERRAGHWRRNRSGRPKIRKPSLKKPLVEDVTRTDTRARRLQDPDVLRRILTQELERLRTAGPAVVLGIPADSPISLITKSARRLRHRYKTVTQDRRMPADVRLLAEELKGLVYAAYKALKHGEVPRSASASEGMVDDIDLLLKEGRRLMVAEKWPQSDRILSRAHRIRIDHPGVLSCLGWVRFHNPTRPAEARSDEALEFLVLAVQFASSNPDARHYLALVLLERGEPEKALRHARLGARLNPGHESLTQLVESLEAQTVLP